MKEARQEQVSGIQSRALSSLPPPSLSLERGWPHLSGSLWLPIGLPASALGHFIPVGLGYVASQGLRRLRNGGIVDITAKRGTGRDNCHGEGGAPHSRGALCHLPATSCTLKEDTGRRQMGPGQHFYDRWG